MLVALGNLFAALELLVVRVFDPERATDFIDAILIRRRIVAAWRFITNGISILPARIWIAGCQSSRSFSVSIDLGLHVPSRRDRWNRAFGRLSRVARHTAEPFFV